METEQERIEYLLANPHLAKKPLGTTPNLRDLKSNCYGTTLWIKGNDNLNFKRWGDVVSIVEGRPGYIPSFAMEGFLENKTKWLKNPITGGIITLWECLRDPELIHSGIYIEEKVVFHQIGFGKPFEKISLDELVPPNEKDRTIIRYFKII